MPGPSSTIAAETDLPARLAALGVVPVATLEDPERAVAVCQALLRGGLGCIEIAFRTPAAAEALRRAATLPGLLVGAGTVLEPEQAAAAAAAGAHFAVAPGLNPELVGVCRELGLPFFPGVATPSEIDQARRLGLRTVKVFPVNTLGGPAFLKAVSATYPDMRFLPTGGIGPEIARDYLALPCVLAVGGSWLVSPDLLREGRFDEVERLARGAVELAAR